MELTFKEQELLSRTYSLEEVKLSRFTKEELDYAVEVAFYRITKNVKKVENASSIFIGGQPGSGKSSEVIRLKEKYQNIIEIIFDHYRAYHPHYLEIEKIIKKHFENKIETENDSKGNDIADFTHEFVTSLSDRLIELASTKDKDNKSYNMIIEWGMRNPKVPLITMNNLKEKGYINIVKFICVHKSISLNACKIRTKVMDDDNHIIRNVPINFHNMCINDLPDSINEIYKVGFSKKIIDEMYLILRNGSIVWDNFNIEVLPGIIFKEYLENYELTKNTQNSIFLAKQNNNKEFEILRKK